MQAHQAGLLTFDLLDRLPSPIGASPVARIHLHGALLPALRFPPGLCLSGRSRAAEIVRPGVLVGPIPQAHPLYFLSPVLLAPAPRCCRSRRNTCPGRHDSPGRHQPDPDPGLVPRVRPSPGTPRKAMGRTPSGGPHHEATASRARLGKRGTVVIPASLRRRFGIEEGYHGHRRGSGGRHPYPTRGRLARRGLHTERKCDSCSRTRWTRKIICRPFARSDPWAWTPTRSPTTSRRGLDPPWTGPFFAHTSGHLNDDRSSTRRPVSRDARAASMISSDVQGVLGGDEQLLAGRQAFGGERRPLLPDEAPRLGACRLTSAESVVARSTPVRLPVVADQPHEARRADDRDGVPLAPCSRRGRAG